jgi:chromosome segregation ATPase
MERPTQEAELKEELASLKDMISELEQRLENRDETIEELRSELGSLTFKLERFTDDRLFEEGQPNQNIFGESVW